MQILDKLIVLFYYFVYYLEKTFDLLVFGVQNPQVALREFGNVVWSMPLLVLLLGGGLYFLLYSRLLPYFYLGHAFQILRGKYDRSDAPGDITHFQALSSALAATIGTEALAHGAAKTNEPVREGLVAMLGPTIDTLLVCSLTAFALLLSGVNLQGGLKGIELTTEAFKLGLPVYKGVALGEQELSAYICGFNYFWRHHQY